MTKISVGLIGKGMWGLKLKSKLTKISNLKFISGKKKYYLDSIDKYKIKWVFIATPNETHYEIVKNCLNKKINVFCEKPLCLSLKKAQKLIEISKKKKVKLYVSDLYDFYSNKIKKLNLENNVYRSKFVKGKDVEFFNRFMYHDISILYGLLKKNIIIGCTFKIEEKKLFKINVKFNNKKEINFIYNLNLNTKKHVINNIDIISKKDYLNKMIHNVLYDKCNIQKNNKKALFIIKYLNEIKKKTKYAN